MTLNDACDGPNFRPDADPALPALAGPVFGLDRLPLVWDNR
jgi:hypothetical protein